MDFNTTFPVLLAGRYLLALFFQDVDLRNDHLLSTPLTAYPRLQEGIYLFQQGFDPYSGGLFRHSPLLLSLFSTILPLTRITSPIVWTAVDGAAAWALIDVWRARINVLKGSREGLIAALYLLNPYTFLPSLAWSTSTFENMLILLSLRFACRGRSSMSLLTFALLVQLSLPWAVMLLPLTALIVSGPESRLALPRPFNADKRQMLPLFAKFAVYSMMLTFASTLVCGNWLWVEQSWIAPLMLPDLTPNPGLWWYFFTEMFDHFRAFFLMVFSVHLLIYIVPICIKFQHDLLYACFLTVGVLATFKAYPTLSDPGLFLSLWSIFPETYPHLRHPMIAGLLHIHSALLLPLFHHLWLVQGTGNANFFYASTLVFGLANGAVLLDTLWAGLRTAMGRITDEYEVIQE
ncbi:PIG-U-domain-containing protein [Laetiporus sulphureus 93-53]|uniref:PIG-U-domain-containing protein n=1 Tax=Laetiporus sulphureus 93-53 TaxID=1314785 RepID=A0A165HLR3_9APHY|nr:PIG-U-domain-containing protein [Laetiporus sulphureus 93-53]KZT11899.1 PIG-U-domain-containing protein [Laetiporus sulphureus 93-53]